MVFNKKQIFHAFNIKRVFPRLVSAKTHTFTSSAEHYKFKHYLMFFLDH